MAVLTVTATSRHTAGVNVATGTGVGGAKMLIATTELAAASSSSTVTFGRIPSHARISGLSRLYVDDLATSGSPTIDIGLYPVNANITADDDALNDGLSASAASTAGVGYLVVKDFANDGKMAWEFVSGQTTDPRGDLIVKAVIRDAATTATGTVTLDLLYTLD